MIATPTPQAETTATNQNSLIVHAKRLIRSLNWLSPTASLISAGSRDFGRSIEASLTEINNGGGILRLKLRQRDAAVVMSIKHYEEMVQLKELYAALIERVREKEIAQATDEYEALYRRITSPQSRKAADILFSATADDLRETYRPGRTET